MAIQERKLGGLVTRRHETMLDRWRLKYISLIRRDELAETVTRIPRYQSELEEVNRRLEQLDREPLRSRTGQLAFVVTDGEF